MSLADYLNKKVINTDPLIIRPLNINDVSTKGKDGREIPI